MSTLTDIFENNQHLAACLDACRDSNKTGQAIVWHLENGEALAFVQLQLDGEIDGRLVDLWFDGFLADKNGADGREYVREKIVFNVVALLGCQLRFIDEVDATMPEFIHQRLVGLVEASG